MLTRYPQADGRLLHVYMKQGGPSPVAPPPVAPEAPPSDPPRGRQIGTELISRSGRDGGSRLNGPSADPEYQDGRYGFDHTVVDDSMDVEANGQAAPRRYERTQPREDYGHRHDSGRYYDRQSRSDTSRDGYYAEEKPRVAGTSDRRGLYSDDFNPRQRGRGFQ